MGTCYSTSRVKDLENKKVVLIYEDDSSSSIIDERQPRRSVGTNALDIPSRKSTLKKPKRQYSNESMHLTNMLSTTNGSDETIPHVASWKNINSSSKIYSPYSQQNNSSSKKSQSSSIYRPRANTDGSCLSKEILSQMTTEDLSPHSQSSITTDIDEDEFADSVSSGMVFKGSFDGLNMRSTNRYDIGLEVLKAKIHHGANAKRLSTHGERTALMFAVLAKDFSFTKKLVKMGVDVNQSNALGETALGLACESQNDEIIDYLRSHGALESVTKRNCVINESL